jgi:hypothetical protein
MDLFASDRRPRMGEGRLIHQAPIELRRRAAAKDDERDHLRVLFNSCDREKQMPFQSLANSMRVPAAADAFAAKGVA